jgi:hypothetical protein
MTQPCQQFVLWTADECDMRIGLHMPFVMSLTSCGIRRRVILKTQVGNDVSEIPVASISRIEKPEGYKPLVLTYQMTRRHAPQDSYLRYCCQSSKIPFANWHTSSTGSPQRIFLVWSNKEDEMGGACGTYCGKEKYVQNFGGKSWGKEVTW